MILTSPGPMNHIKPLRASITALFRMSAGKPISAGQSSPGIMGASYFSIQCLPSTSMRPHGTETASLHAVAAPPTPQV